MDLTSRVVEESVEAWEAYQADVAGATVGCGSHGGARTWHENPTHRSSRFQSTPQPGLDALQDAAEVRIPCHG